MEQKKVAVIMGSLSDWEAIKPCINTLSEWEIPYEAHVFSAHRSPIEAAKFAEDARKNGFGVIIAAAGMAAHLAGALAARTTLPVIGIPVSAKQFDGMDALLATVQMPSGIPVATVAVNGAKNAAILSMQILAVADSELAERLNEEREKMHEGVLKKDAELQAKLEEEINE